MSKENAKAFLEHLLQNEEAAEKFHEVQLKDLRDATAELIQEGKIKDKDISHWPI